jgi:hypothetical protein
MLRGAEVTCSFKLTIILATRNTFPGVGTNLNFPRGRDKPELPRGEDINTYFLMVATAM